MPDIHIHRDHHLGFKEARKVAFSWAEKAEETFDMECTYEEGEKEDLLTFTRTGVKGTLLVDAHQFEMKAQLGFLLGAFKDRPSPPPRPRRPSSPGHRHDIPRERGQRPQPGV